MTAERIATAPLAGQAWPPPAASPGGAQQPGPRDTAEDLRERLGEFRALLVISLLMTESVNEDQILELAASSAQGLGSWRVEGYGFTDGQWHPGIPCAAPSPRGLAAQLAALGTIGGEVE